MILLAKELFMNIQCNYCYEILEDEEGDHGRPSKVDNNNQLKAIAGESLRITTLQMKSALTLLKVKKDE